EEHLILTMVDDLAQHVTAAGQIAASQLAFEDRILRVVPKPAHRLVHPSQAEIVRDVVAKQVGIAHGRGLYALAGSPWQVKRRLRGYRLPRSAGFWSNEHVMKAGQVRAWRGE